MGKFRHQYHVYTDPIRREFENEPEPMSGKEVSRRHKCRAIYRLSDYIDRAFELQFAPSTPHMKAAANEVIDTIRRMPLSTEARTDIARKITDRWAMIVPLSPDRRRQVEAYLSGRLLDTQPESARQKLVENVTVGRKK